VVKTEPCFFSELKIYPGHGRRYVRKDGKLLAFIDRKCRSLFLQKIKAQRLRWTQAWRRKNKKVRVEAIAKKRVKRVGKVFRTIQGISMDDLKKKRTMKPEVRKAAQEAATREVKERKQKEKAGGKTEKKTAGAKKAPTLAKSHVVQGGFVKVPKTRMASRPQMTIRK